MDAEINARYADDEREQCGDREHINLDAAISSRFGEERAEGKVGYCREHRVATRKALRSNFCEMRRKFGASAVEGILQHRTHDRAAGDRRCKQPKRAPFSSQREKSGRAQRD